MLESQSRVYRRGFSPSFQLNFKSKNRPLGRRPGPGKDDQNTAKTPLFVMSPPEIPTENEKRYFSILTTRLAESVEGLNSSLALAARKLWPKECRPRSWPFSGRKGLKVKYSCGSIELNVEK